MLQFMCSDIDIKLNMNMSLHIKDINVFKNSISSEEDIELTCSFKLQDEETLYSIKLYKVRVQNYNQVYCNNHYQLGRCSNNQNGNLRWYLP